MAEPLQSGRIWGEDPEGNFLDVGGRTTRVWLHDQNDREVRAMFKRPGANALPGELYSMGIERVAYTLGDSIGVPIPATYLETYGGELGSVQMKPPNARTWQQAPGCPMLMDEIVNEDEVALGVAFDIWLANHDRVERNLLAQANPPDRQPKFAMRCRVWLIDNGCGGLWMSAKFENSKGDPADTVEDVVLPADCEMRVPLEQGMKRITMPRRYRETFTTGRSEDNRKELVDKVRNISDNQIERAVAEVPAGYMSDRARELTVELLKVRRDRLDTLSALPW